MVIGAVEQRHIPQGWRKVKVAMDSGAAESVIPVGEVPEYPPTPLKEMVYYQTASGETIANEGEQVLPVLTENGHELKAMTFQACDVTKPLASVKRVVDAGHVVVFGPPEIGGSYVMNLSTWECEPLIEEDGNYNMNLWVPDPRLLESFGRHP
jgi:hypothetical protein